MHAGGGSRWEAAWEVMGSVFVALIGDLRAYCNTARSVPVRTWYCTHVLVQYQVFAYQYR